MLGLIHLLLVLLLLLLLLLLTTVLWLILGHHRLLLVLKGRIALENQVLDQIGSVLFLVSVVLSVARFANMVDQHL